MRVSVARSVFAFALLGFPFLMPTGQAQEAGLRPENSAEAASAPDNGPRSTTVVPLRHVAPSNLAWSVDPQHNTAPPEIELSQRYNADQEEQDENVKPGDRYRQPVKALFVLPPGVDSVVPGEAANTLKVVSSEAGLQKLQALVNLLDQPQRAVEIEMRVVAIAPADVEALGSIAGTPNESDSLPSLFYGHDELDTRLTALLKQGKATIVSTRRLRLLNNLTGGLGKAGPSVAERKARAEEQRNAPSMALAIDKTKLTEAVSALTLVVTPTIENGGSVTVALTWLQTLRPRLNFDKPPSANASYKLRGLNTYITVQGGKTFAFSGFSSEELAADLVPDAAFAAQPAVPLTIFFTPRILPLEKE